MSRRTKNVLAMTGYALPFLMACYEWWHRRQIVKPRQENPWYKEPRTEQWARL